MEHFLVLFSFLAILIGGFAGFLASFSFEPILGKYYIKKFTLGEWLLMIIPLLICIILLVYIHVVMSHNISIIEQNCIIKKVYDTIKEIELLQIFLLYTLWGIAVIFLGMITKCCPDQKDYDKKDYSPQDYAHLQSEKAEITLIGGGLSLGSLINITDFWFPHFLLFFSGYIAFLLALYYRHLTYALTMQETKKKLYEIKVEANLKNK